MKWIRKLLLASTLALSLPAHSFDGLTLGIEGGVIQAQARTQQTSDLFGNQNFEIDSSNQSKATDISGIGGLILGYSQSLNPCWIIGVEARGNWANYHTEQSIQTNVHVQQVIASFENASIRSHIQYGILGKIGYYIAPCSQLYALIGPQWSHIDISVGDKLELTVSPDVYSAALSRNITVHPVGLWLGFGLEHLLRENVSFGLEYHFVTYGALPSININGQFLDNGLILPGSSTNTTLGIHLKTNATLLRVNYYFPI